MEQEPLEEVTGRREAEDEELDDRPRTPGNATFIVLGQYKPESLERLTKPDNDARDDRELADGLAQESGARLLDIWFTTGVYDVVLVLGDATARTALTFALAFGAAAQVSTQTLAAESRLGAVASGAAYARARTQRGAGGRTQRGET